MPILRHGVQTETGHGLKKPLTGYRCRVRALGPLHLRESSRIRNKRNLIIQFWAGLSRPAVRAGTLFESCNPIQDERAFATRTRPRAAG